MRTLTGIDFQCSLQFSHDLVQAQRICGCGGRGQGRRREGGGRGGRGGDWKYHSEVEQMETVGFRSS